MKYYLSLCVSLVLSLSAHANLLVKDKLSLEGEPKNFRMQLSAHNRNMKQFGSGEFTENWLRLNQDGLPRPLVMVDLRQEPHGLVNGVPYTWYTGQNIENLGLPAELIDVKEHLWLKKVQERHPKTYVQTEKDLVEPYGIQYVRMPIQDHHAPSLYALKQMLARLNVNNTNNWLYFHCRAGVGRTTLLMTAVDIMRNHDKDSFMTILKRQARIGGKNYYHFYPVDSYKYPLLVERYRLLKALYEDQHGINRRSQNLTG